MGTRKEVSLDEWKNAAIVHHENFASQLGDRIWDNFHLPSENIFMLHKITIPLFGKHMTGTVDLSSDQMALAHDIVQKCIRHSINRSQIRMAVIFTLVYVDKTIQTIVPVIRVMSHPGQTFQNIPDNIFIDHSGRVYDNWEKYKAQNTLNMTTLCVPKDGYYSSKSNYEFLDQRSRGEVLNEMDHYSTYVNVASGLAMLGGILLSLFPPTAPIGATVILGSTIVGAPGAIYGVGRSVDKLVDRVAHEQSISLADAEARQCWLLTASSLLSIGPVAAGRIIAEGAEAGRVFSAVTRAAVTTLNVTTSTVAALGIMNSIYELAHKGNVSAMDYLQLTTSIFFFSHSFVYMSTASSIIANAQEKQLSGMRNSLLPEQQVIHDALLTGTKEVVVHGQVKEMQGQAQFIREMKRIGNVEDFYSHFGIKTDGQLYINSELTIDPKAFVQMSESDRMSLLNLSRRLNDREITLAQFNREAAPIQKQYRLRLDRQRYDAEVYLKNAFRVGDLADIRVGNNRLGVLKPSDIDRLEQVVKNSFHNGDRELMAVAETFAKRQGASNLTEYCAAGEYAVRQVEVEVKARRAIDPNPLRGSGVKVKDFYKSQVVNEIMNYQNKMEDLNTKFNELRAEVDAVNTGHPKFNNSMAAANHYDKHPFFPKVDPRNNLSCEMYFNIATEMAGGPITDINWTQDGSALKCTFNSEKYGATAIRYDNLANHTSVIATLMATNVKENRFISSATAN